MTISRLISLREAPILVFFLVITGAACLWIDGFMAMATFDNISRQIAVIGILSVGMTLVVITGGIDLSVGAVMAFATAVGGMFAIPGGWPIWLSYPLILGLGLGLGWLNGMLVVRFAVHPMIVTLGTMSIIRGLVMVITEGRYITPIPSAYLWIGAGYRPFVALLVVLLLAHFVLRRTKFGRNLYATGGNIDAAALSGVPVDRDRVRVYTVSGLLAALAGLILVGRSGFIQPQVAFDGYEMSAIAAVVIGGASIFGGNGTVIGTFLGAAVLGVILAAMTMLSIDSYWQGCVQGALIVAAITLEYLRQRHAENARRLARRAA